jgi:presenilin-like A22 family membrane protease
MGLLFLATQLLALILAIPFKSLGVQAFEDPEDPVYPIIYFMLLMVFTAIILLVVRYFGGRPIKILFLFLMGYVIFYVFLLVFYIVYPYYWILSGFYINVPVLLSFIIAVLFTILLHKHPEWYVINATGLIVGAGAIAILGNSFGVLSCFILLISLAIYDAISVYKTKHMLDLADTAIDMKLPMLMVVPKDEGYSFIKQTSSDLKATMPGKIEDGTVKAPKKERDAMFMGLGDVIIPGVLVVSSYIFLPVHFTSGLFAPIVVALSTMAGSFVGYLMIMTLAARGNPQAGLPLLNSGAIIGYSISYFAMYQDLALGIA